MLAGIDMVVTGKVQGVWFRGSTQSKARELGLSGWVKNNDNGTVSVQAFGKMESLNQLLQWCRSGPSHAIVTDIRYHYIDHQEMQGFVVSRT